jgi:oligopeptide transport system permease protein
VLEKIFETVTSLVLLATLTFFLLKFLPGAPFDDERSLNPTVLSKLNEQWKLNDAWYVQAVSYITSVAQGHMGVSMARPERTVSEILWQGLANTFTINAISLILVVCGALALAVLSMRYRGSLLDTFVDQAAIALVALPVMFWGPLLIYFFGFYLGILPVALLGSPAHYILPVLTMSARPLASLTRLLKNSLIETDRFEYVRTARAKGLSPWRVLIHHVLRNSMIPFLSYLGPLCVSILSGSVLVEILFAIPGLGSEFLSALNDRDYTLIAGVTFFYGFFLIIINSVLDLIVKIIDPRLREDA